MLGSVATLGLLMKRFVFAGLFFMLGLIILGVATASLMSGPDKPVKPRMAGPNASYTQKPKPGGGAEVNNAQLPDALRPSSKSSQPTAAATPTLLPGMPVPLSTAVQPPSVRPSPQPTPQHVPVIQPTAGRQHQ
jgi:hypothetical protein